MDSAPLFELPPGPAATCILRHLSKHDKCQLSLSCKHAHTLALSSVTQLALGYKWYSGRVCHATFPNCTSVTLKPRTMDELSKLASKLLLNKIQKLPALTELRLELQGVYDKLCDISLILKSVVLHTKQLTSICIDQGASVSAKAMGFLVEMPTLTSLTIKTAHGFEPGALANLANVSNTLTHLHLEVTDGSGSSPAAQPKMLTPSELARLQASDEVGLAKCSRLVSLAAVNLTKPGTSAFRPVEALLQAIAGLMSPKLCKLVLANMPDLPVTVLELVAGISSLTAVSLAGCSMGGSADVAKLSVLAGLQELVVAPQQPSTSVLNSLAKGCKQLSKLTMGGATVNPALSMPAVTDLQILALSPYSIGMVNSSSSNNMTGAMSSVSLRAKPPLQLSGFNKVWAGLKSLQISGHALDSAGVAALSQLQGLESLRILGGPDAAVSAKLLLPLLSLPALQQLHFLGLADLTDEWMAEAVKTVGSAAGANFPAVRDLQLGAASTAAGPLGEAVNSSAGDKASLGAGNQSSVLALAMCGHPNQMLTDRGLVRLFACPKLQKLRLVQLQGITLAGIKALVRGSATLQVVEVIGCAAVSAAPAEAVAKAAVAGPDRAVDLTVR